jgi:hypothetical protein
VITTSHSTIGNAFWISSISIGAATDMVATAGGLVRFAHFRRPKGGSANGTLASVGRAERITGSSRGNAEGFLGRALSHPAQADLFPSLLGPQSRLKKCVAFS